MTWADISAAVLYIKKDKTESHTRALSYSRCICGCARSVTLCAVYNVSNTLDLTQTPLHNHVDSMSR